MKKIKVALIVTSLSIAVTAQAQVSPERTSNSEQIESSVTSSQDMGANISLSSHEKSLAKQWMLEESDWVKYKKIMSGPRGIWSPGLDPITALGVSETDARERARYARLWMEVESRRMGLELAFEVERQRAGQVMFAGQKVIDNTEWIREWNEAYNEKTQNIAFFVNDDCLDECESLFNEVNASVSRHSRLDVFFSSGASAESIGEWASYMNISPDTVRSRKITLNFESGSGKAAEYDINLGDLPAVKVIDAATGQVRDYQ
jgi:integrating conjugative element protein (TIGR03759 family)